MSSSRLFVTITSSDPFSETTPVVPLTVPDTGTTTDIQKRSEPGGKRWKQDVVAKEKLVSCAEDAASKATKEMVSLTMKDAEQREQRLVERDKRLMEHLDVVVKGILKGEPRCRISGRRLKRNWKRRSCRLQGGYDHSGRASHSDKCVN